MEFNRLFNKFFKKEPLDYEKIEETKKVIGMINDLSSKEDSIDEKVELTFGKPSEIQYYNEGDIFFEKRIWHTSVGDIVKIIISDDPSLVTTPPDPLSLEQQLDIAINEENYEKAAAIRDEIKHKRK